MAIATAGAALVGTAHGCELDFASASSLERHVADHLAAHPDVRHLCLFAQPINRIDITGVEVFVRLRSLARTCLRRCTSAD